MAWIAKRTIQSSRVRKKIMKNNAKYPEIFVKISTTPGIITKPFKQVTDEEVRKNLLLQVELLCVKEIKETSLI